MSQQDTHELEDGFYWVRVLGVWKVLEQIDGAWYTVGSDESLVGVYIDEIDPRPIVRPE